MKVVNKKTFLLVILTITLSLSLRPQSNKMGISNEAYKKSMDSLEILLKNSIHDSTRMNIFLLMSDLAVTSDPSLAKEYCLKIKEIGEGLLKDPQKNKNEKLKAKKLVGIAFGNLGYIAKHQNDIEHTEFYLEQALKISKELNDIGEVGKNQYNLAGYYKDVGEPEKSLALYKESIKALEQAGDKKNLAYAHTGLSDVYNHFGDQTASLKQLAIAQKLTQETKDQQGEASVLCFMAVIYNKKANVPHALKLYDKALTILEKLDDIPSIMGVLNIIGTIYTNQGELDRALAIFERVLVYSEKRKAKNHMASALHNIASIHLRKNKIAEAITSFEKSLELASSIDDMHGMANTLVSLGSIYKKYPDPNCQLEKEMCSRSSLEKSYKYFTDALNIYIKIKSKKGVSLANVNLSGVYLMKKNYRKAIESGALSFKLGTEMNSVENLRAASKSLYDVYKTTGDHSNALKYYEVYVKMNDSIESDRNKKAAIRSHLKYDYEKQAAADSVAHAKESEIKNAEIAKQTVEIKAKKNQQYALFGGLGLVIIFAGFMYNRFKVTQKQKAIIEEQKHIVEEQKHLVEEKQKEILDSIHYAKRIQLAQIPSEKRVDVLLKKLRNHEGK